MFIVDSQVHIWKEETPDRPWVPGARERIRLNGHREEAFLYEECLELMDEAGVDRVIIVPPSWEATVSTTRWRRLRPTPIASGSWLVEPDRAPGPLALTLAMREAIAVARQTGVAWAAVRSTVHTGAIGYYTSMAAAEGLAGIGIVAGVPNMAYEGARGAAVATSPLAIALPASRHPDFVLDMATATIALGKIAQYKARGELLPEGAAVTVWGSRCSQSAATALRDQ